MRIVIVVILFFLNLTFMYAVETSGEKFQAKKKKAIQQTREIFCTNNDPGCLSRKRVPPEQKKKDDGNAKKRD